MSGAPKKGVVPPRTERDSGLKRVHSMTFEYGLRNFTVKDIRDLKGKRQLTEVGLFNVEEAHAAVDAGVDLITCRYNPVLPELAKAVRKAAPALFQFCALPLTPVASEEQARRLALDVMEMGADSIICQWSPKFIEAAAECGVPVRGHIGLVPRRSTWTGGLRSVGKTLDEALALYQQLKDLENAGAWAVECEVMPTRILAELTKRTSLVTSSLGSGPGDVQFLFAQDILGDGHPPFPRHSKQYCDLQAIRDQMQAMRVEAFQAYVEDVREGVFPAQLHEVSVEDAVVEALVSSLDR